jgi:hypothetical protein
LEITEHAKLDLDFQNLNALMELAGMAEFLKVRGALATHKSMVVAVLEAVNELLRMFNANLGRIQSTAASEMRQSFDIALIAMYLIEFVSYVVFIFVRRRQLRKFKID